MTNSHEKPDPERLTASWSAFWTRPAITALPEVFPDGYDGPMVDFWQEELDGEFNHIVDLATGNGAVIWIAHEIQRKRANPAKLTGVDLAAIDPFTALKKPRYEYPTVSFIGNTSIDSLPFADRSIDVVVSQYGIEYSDLTKTIAEAARVLTPSGKMCFIVHDQESVIVKGVKDKLIHCREMIADRKFHDLTRRLIELLGRFTNAAQLQNSAEFQALGRQINKKMLQLRPRLEQYPKSSPLNPYIYNWNISVSPFTPMAKPERKRKAQAALEELIARTENLAEVDAAALTAADREALASLIEQYGFRISRFETLEFKDGRNWGTKLVAHH